MKYFERLMTGLDVQPIIDKLEQMPELWDQFTARQDAPGSPHKDTRCILILGPKAFDLETVFNDLDTVPYPPFADLFAEIRWVMVPLMQAVGVENGEGLGRVMLAELAPGGAITPHADGGAYAAHYSRFHIVISSDHGNRFTCGDETVDMEPGEAWWFDHRKVHFVVNNSNTPRVHLIIDVVSPHYSVAPVAEGEELNG